MEQENAKYIVIGAVAGLAGYYAYTRSGLLSAPLAVFAVSWLVYRLSSGDKIWGTLGMFTNPATSALLFFLAGFTFLSLQGTPFSASLVIAFALAAIGAVTGMIVHKYWNP